MHYVIGDVHGQYSLLMMLLEKLNVDEEKDEVYFVGDLLKRAPTREEQLETIKFYVEQFNNPNSCYKTVLGNHENAFIVSAQYQSAFKNEQGQYIILTPKS